MPITLGKDCTIVLDNGAIASARNVTLSESAKTIEIAPFGSREVGVYSVGYECAVTVEFNDQADLGTAFTHMHAGTTFQVSGGVGGFGFTAVLVSITESDPIDGVATFTLEARMSPGAASRAST